MLVLMVADAGWANANAGNNKRIKNKILCRGMVNLVIKNAHIKTKSFQLQAQIGKRRKIATQYPLSAPSALLIPFCPLKNKLTPQNYQFYAIIVRF